MTFSIADGTFRVLTDEIPSLIFCADAHGEAIHCNRKFQDFTGLADSALVGGAWLLAVHEDDRSAASAAWTQAIAAEEPYEVELRLRAADGHYHWFLIRCVPAATNGRVDHWVGVGVDIHDRKLSEASEQAEHERTQDALAGSEARYRTIFQSMFNFVGLLGPDGVLLDANDAALAFGGVSAAEVVGRKFWDTPWWDVGEAARLQLRGAIAAAAAGAFVRYEATVNISGGRRALIDFTLKPVVDARGVVRQIIPEGRDLTHIKAVEKQLLESRARVQRIVDSGIIGVGYGNIDGVIADVNDAFLKMIGKTREDFTAGRISWRELTAPEYSQRDERAIAQLRRDGVCEPYEKEYVLPGRRLPVQIAMARVESETPDIDHVALIVDLTAQKEAQAALAASHAQLEQRVAERTAELRQANERLVQEMKRREALQGALLQSQKLEALGQLTSSVAHDFNNVLAAIIGGFALIETRTRDPQLQKLATEGTKAADRGADLIRKLLAFARQQNVVSQRVELQPLFEDLAPQLRHVAGSTIEVNIADARSLPAIEIDPSQLQAAITNLVVNARDAMRDGGRVSIHFQDVPPDHPDKPPELGGAAAVAIHVADNGAGIGAPVLQRVLEPFFTTKAPGRGTGLGLAMVHGLMMQSGGALRLQSVVGGGTTVSLYVPVSLAAPAVGTPELAANDFRVHAGGRVLLVEDDDLVRDVVTDQLMDLGYQVVRSDSAADAMTTVNDGEALVFIVTDHSLAGSNGAELVAEVRGIRPNLPILFITGRADPKGLENEAVLLKPFSPDALSKSVLDMVEGSQHRDEGDAALDRLAARFRSTALQRMLASWRSARLGDTPPPARSVSVTRDEMDFVCHVAVDQTRVPMTFELTKVGAELARRADAGFAWRMEVTGENAETSREGAYRRCVRSKRPTYDFARFDFGREGGSSFERLLLPCSEDGAGVTSLIVVVKFDQDTPGRGPNP